MLGRGCFVSFGVFRIWVWESQLDHQCPTYLDAAERTFRSGWLDKSMMLKEEVKHETRENEVK